MGGGDAPGPDVEQRRPDPPDRLRGVDPIADRGGGLSETFESALWRCRRCDAWTAASAPSWRARHIWRFGHRHVGSPLRPDLETTDQEFDMCRESAGESKPVKRKGKLAGGIPSRAKRRKTSVEAQRRSGDANRYVDLGIEGERLIEPSSRLVGPVAAAVEPCRGIESSKWAIFGSEAGDRGMSREAGFTVP
ncbi:hypothetical protein OIU85_001107 [Salix viminalis]|uniref:Uncharacterized protein n=1 Tax=Salix viminalis TaxID=40686 RepID=A0A9Q0VKX6_SALVM|nr:hypothetical protein OIU85_001107 [Salix viminalis]